MLTVRAVQIIALVVGLLLAGAGPVVGDDNPTHAANSIEQWVSELGSDSFKTRKSATRRLMTAGVPALESLLRATESDDLEVRKRANRILETTATNDGKFFDALLKVATSAQGDSIIADRILRSPRVQTAFWARRQKRVNRLVADAHRDVEDGKLKPAREKVNNADRLREKALMYDSGVKLLRAKIEYAETLLAVKSGAPGAKARLKQLEPQRKRLLAYRLLKEARVAIVNGNLEFARKKVLVAEKLDAVYGLFDDRPALVLNDIRRVSKAPR